jgi:hypothetical protein
VSARQVLGTLTGLLQDDERGLEARMIELVPLAEAPVSTTLRFLKWQLADAMSPATAHNVCVRPRGIAAALADGGERDGTVLLQVLFEAFSSDPDEIQETVLIAASALLRCMDELRAYSDDTDGTVIDLPQPVSIRFGEFEGATRGGFIADLTINERGSE